MSEKEIFESITELTSQGSEPSQESVRNQELWEQSDANSNESADSRSEFGAECESNSENSLVEFGVSETEKLDSATEQSWSERDAFSKYEQAHEKLESADTFLETAEGVGDWISTAGEAMSGIGDALQTNWSEGFGEKAEFSAQQKSDIFEDGNNSRFEMVEAVSGEVLEMLGQAGGDYVGTAMSSIGEAVTGVGDSIGAVAEGLQTAQDCSIADGVDQIIDGVSDAAGNSLSGALSATGKGLANAGVEVAKGVEEIVREFNQRR